jgi:hypothetical protein
MPLCIRRSASPCSARGSVRLRRGALSSRAPLWQRAGLPSRAVRVRSPSPALYRGRPESSGASLPWRTWGCDSPRPLREHEPSGDGAGPQNRASRVRSSACSPSPMSGRIPARGFYPRRLGPTPSIGSMSSSWRIQERASEARHACSTHAEDANASPPSDPAEPGRGLRNRACEVRLLRRALRECRQGSPARLITSRREAR